MNKNTQIINVISNTGLSGFYIVYKGSTLNETKGYYGASHAIEHLLCKSFDHLQDDFSQYGIDWNAYTSENDVVFYFTGLESQIARYRDKLLDLIIDFKFTEEQFKNEIKIVLEEYGDAFNDQMSIHSGNLERKLFNLYGPIGLREDLENITFEQLTEFKDKYLAIPNLIINISPTSIFETTVTLPTYSSDKQYEYQIRADFPYEGKVTPKDKSCIILTSPVYTQNGNYDSLITSLLGSGLQSPLYQEIREKRGLVYFVGSYVSRLNTSHFSNIYTQTSTKNIDAIQDIVADIFSNLEKHITRERFNVVVEGLKINKQKNDILNYTSIGKYITPKDYVISNILNTATYDEVMDIAKQRMKWDEWYKSVDTEEFKNFH